jgi:hypothetical protein
MRSTPVTLGEVVAGPDGRATAAVTIPTEVAAGGHHLYMLGLTSRVGAQAATQVVGAPQLAVTGLPVIATVLLSVVCVVIGAVFVRLGEGAAPCSDRSHE